MILIEADNFKYFNDQYGHDFGDAVLSSVAALMSGKLRESDYIIGRYGDEFLDFAPRTRQAEVPVLHSGFWTRGSCSTSKIPCDWRQHGNSTKPSNT